MVRREMFAIEHWSYIGHLFNHRQLGKRQEDIFRIAVL